MLHARDALTYFFLYAVVVHEEYFRTYTKTYTPMEKCSDGRVSSFLPAKSRRISCCYTGKDVLDNIHKNVGKGNLKNEKIFDYL